MIDFKQIAQRIKNKAFSCGYRVDAGVLSERLEEDEKRHRLYRRVFATEDGHWVLMDLMAEGGLLSSHDIDNSLTLAHLEGKRSMAIRIASILGLTFDQVVHMYSDIGKGITNEG